MEQQGLPDNPSYIEELPNDHFIHSNENVFGFAMNSAGLMVLRLLNLVMQLAAISDTGMHLYHFVAGLLDKDKLERRKSNCLSKDHVGPGDGLPCRLI